MDCATRPIRFKTDEEWRVYKREYLIAWNLANPQRKKLVSMGILPKRRRTHAKKRRS